MSSAKDLVVKPIGATDARAFVRKHHYSGKVDTRSQVHLGVFWNDKLEGCMQFGPSIDKNKSIGLVKDTPWNAFIELHRMAFSDVLPRNSESRAIAVAMRMLKKNAPHIQWVVSYADGTQCGDGTIYRASGFHLVGVRKNTSMWRMPDGEVVAKIVFEPGFSPNAGSGSIKARYGKTGTETSTAFLRSIGAEMLPGFQIKYIYFLDPTARERLTVPILPFSDIDRLGAKMYLGEKPGVGGVSNTSSNLLGNGGASPTPTLHQED